MSAVTRLSLAMICGSTLLAGGCMMPGMTYKVAMPPSVTFKTQKADGASMASSETRDGRISPVMQRSSDVPLDLQ